MEAAPSGSEEGSAGLSKTLSTNFPRFGGLIAAFFCFDVEMVVFSSLNVWQPVTEHWILAMSFYISMFYMGFMICSVPLIIVLTNRPKEILESEEYKSNFETFYEGYKLDDGVSKHFRAFSVLRFLFFGLVLVFFYYIPLLQISCSFLIALTYLILVYTIKPHEEMYEYYVELTTESLFTIGNFLFLILGLDDSYGLISVGTRVFIGWLIFFVYILALVISVCLVIYEIIETIKMLKKKFCDPKEDNEELSVDVKNSKKVHESRVVTLPDNQDSDLNPNMPHLTTDRMPLNDTKLDQIKIKQIPLKKKSEKKILPKKKLLAPRVSLPKEIVNVEPEPDEEEQKGTKKNSNDKPDDERIIRQEDIDKIKQRVKDEEKVMEKMKKEANEEMGRKSQSKRRRDDIPMFGSGDFIHQGSLANSRLSGLDQYKKDDVSEDSL